MKKEKKAPLHLLLPVGMIEESWVMEMGVEKHGKYNWRSDGIVVSDYTSAAQRHILQWSNGENKDSESGLSHLAHAKACLSILIDAISICKFIDDRPEPVAHLNMESPNL